jgi:hypothetical protein
LSKVTGLGTTTCTVDDVLGTARAISNDVQSIEVSTPRGVFDVTGVNKSAFERILGLSDGKVTIKGVFNNDANKSHMVFMSVTGHNVARTVAILFPGATITMEIAFSEYSVTRGGDGALQWTTTGELATGTAPVWS